MRLTTFGITLNNELITSLPVSSKDSLGIGLDRPPIPGMVSGYEEHDCRYEAGYTLDKWYDIAPEDRAIEIALYRVRHAIEYQKNKAQQREMEKIRNKK